MLLQHHNYVFSAAMVLCSKAQREENGYPLVKRCNAAAKHHGSALRVSLSAPMDRVAPLNNGVTIIREASLAMNADKLTEFTIMMLKEH